MEGRKEAIHSQGNDRRTDGGQVCEGLRLHFNTRRPEGGLAWRVVVALAWRVVVALELCPIRV